MGPGPPRAKDEPPPQVSCILPLDALPAALLTRVARKRAKTEDEKEQRRVERVLRNRRAAQSSRERKRLEVEALERKTKDLEMALANAQKANMLLVEELNRFRRASGVVTRSSSPLDPLRDNQVTLSQQLFGSQDGRGPVDDSAAANLVDELILANPNPTVNPASLSPELGPISDEADADAEADAANLKRQVDAEPAEQDLTTSPDLTQRPAAMLCDLPCHTSAEVPKSFANSQTHSPLLAWTLFLRMTLLSASAILSTCRRPLTQIAMSSKAGFSLLPTPQLLTTIIWLVTLPPASRASTPSTSTTSSTMTRQPTPPLTLWQRATLSLSTSASSRKSSTLRFKSLRQILSSSPSLARPLMDATMEALRLVTAEGCDDRVADLRSESGATRDEVDPLIKCLRRIALPPPEVLLTLLWALEVEAPRIQQRSRSEAVVGPESGSLSASVAANHGHKVASGTKRGRGEAGGGAPKRCHLS